jgi:hypothetical protein
MSAASTPEPQSPSRRTRIRKLSRRDRNEIVELTALGWSGPRLARRYAVDRSRITQVLTERGFGPRPRHPAAPVTADERREIVKLRRLLGSTDAVVLVLRGRGTPRAASTVRKVVREGSDAG